MLEEEMKWLDTAINSQEVAPGDSVTGSLLAGHLKLIATLFTCHGVNKRKRPGLVQQLLDDFLFPASTVMLQRTGTSIPSSSSRHPVRQRCSTTESQEAAYQLLVTLAEGCAENLKEIVARLIAIHHSFNPEIAKEWEVWLLVL
jgi:ubiquitin carboxyl-terminal hydrolase 9/24